MKSTFKKSFLLLFSCLPYNHAPSWGGLLGGCHDGDNGSSDNGNGDIGNGDNGC